VILLTIFLLFSYLSFYFFDKIAFFDDKNIAQVSAGDYHSLCLDRTGRNLFSFGKGALGELGVIENPSRDFCQSQPQAVFLDHRTSVNPTIRSIACGENHNMVVTAAGDLYTWGFGDYGEMANRSEGIFYLPTRADANNVLQATGGAHHTVVLSAARIE
jgi:alpha-tubulin suppressor-like RCC1 family protein